MTKLKIGTKFILSLLCIAAIVAGLAAVFVWQSSDLLYGLGQLTDASVDEAMYSVQIQTLLYRNSRSIELFLADKHLGALDTPGSETAR